jgi:hypothetical protein
MRKLISAGLLLFLSPTLVTELRAATLELNKLEPRENGCRAYLVMGNLGPSGFQNFKLDLIVFRKDGIIDRRLAVDVGPLHAGKTTVRTFDLESTPCNTIGSVLLNDVLDCKLDGGLTTDCLSNLSVSSRASAEFQK